jgi:hypothetical protein
MGRLAGLGLVTTGRARVDAYAREILAGQVWWAVA